MKIIHVFNKIYDSKCIIAACLTDQINRATDLSIKHINVSELYTFDKL